jgi:hypothetical protein
MSYRVLEQGNIAYLAQKRKQKGFAFSLSIYQSRAPFVAGHEEQGKGYLAEQRSFSCRDNRYNEQREEFSHRNNRCNEHYLRSH